MKRRGGEKSTALDMTQGPILRQLVFFALPLMLGNVFQMLYNTVDSVIVGNFVGKEALAAVGSTTVIVGMIVFFFSGFSIGAGVVIGNNFGAKNMERLHDAIHTTVAAAFVLSLLLTLVGVAAVKPMLRLMRTPEDVFENAALYLRIYLGGISGLLIYNMGSGILRAVGDSIRPLGFLILTSILNTLLDLVFVIGLKTGIAGAAIATVLSQFVSAALILTLLTRTKDIYRLNWKELHIDFPILKKIFAIGMPAALQTVITSFSNIFVQGYINFFGSDVMAGWSSYNKLDYFIYLPMQSMSIAATTFVSQNMGAGDEKRSRQGTLTAILMTTLVTGAAAVVLFAFAPGAVRMFSPDSAVIRYGVMFIRTNVFFLLFNAVSQVLAGALRGRGDSRGPMIIMLFCFVAVRQVYLFWVTHCVANTPRLVGFGYPVGWMCCFVIEVFYAWYRQRRVTVV
jgi:putative MATE family efflux protein